MAIYLDKIWYLEVWVSVEYSQPSAVDLCIMSSVLCFSCVRLDAPPEHPDQHSQWPVTRPWAGSAGRHQTPETCERGRWNLILPLGIVWNLLVMKRGRGVGWYILVHLWRLEACTWTRKSYKWHFEAVVMLMLKAFVLISCIVSAVI